MTRDQKTFEIAGAIAAALRQPWTAFRGNGSLYAAYGDSMGIKLRVSDHAQVDGGGWLTDDFGSGRSGRAAVSWVVRRANTRVPTRDEIRSVVARAAREYRAQNYDAHIEVVL